MRQRNVKNCQELLDAFDRYIPAPESFKGKWKGEFEAVHLEIGIGKGQYIFNKAIQNPEVLFIGIELNKGVIALATKKIKRLEEDMGKKADNLRLFAYDAIKLEEVFEKSEVDRIYLNFSDPWPKNKHEKRRLTSSSFLAVYKEVLNESGKVEQKTDNRSLFEYSIMSYNQNKMDIEELSLNVYSDLESGKILDNIPTEYEEKFRDKGPIYKTIVKFGGKQWI